MTLTIDADVAAVLNRLRKTSDASFKDLINEALRRGLQDMNEQPTARKPFCTRSVDLGQPKIGSIDNVSEALAIVEGKAFK